jgi:hypothetical protein
MCKNALPISAPAENPIRHKRILWNNLSFIAKVKIPISERRLTIDVLIRIKARIMEGIF